MVWARNFDATFEPSKYKIMHFNRRRKKLILKQIKAAPDITGLNKSTAPVKEVKVLGVVLDEKLTWSAHVAAVGFLLSWLSCNMLLTTIGCEQAQST